MKLSLLIGVAATAKSLQLCPTLCDPIDGSPPGSPGPWDSPGKNTGVGCHCLLQCMKVKSESEVAQSCPTLCDPMDIQSMSFLGQNTVVGSLSLHQGIFPTQGLNPGLLHCGLILYQLSHKGSPRILEWVAYPFSSGSSWPRNRTGVSCIAGGFFTNWALEFNLGSAVLRKTLYPSLACFLTDEWRW